MKKHKETSLGRFWYKSSASLSITLLLVIGVIMTVQAYEIPPANGHFTEKLSLFLGLNEVEEESGLLCTDDVHGANDEPGQKDLTRMCVDSKVDPLKLEFNWDEIFGGGENTFDSCNMFDTDGNGNVDFSFCVTVQANESTDIMEYKNISLYSCGDDKSDRCTQPVTTIPPSFGTTCSVSQQDLDPFPAGDAYPQDTVGKCNLVRSDVGGDDAILINVCSFPSQQPNSDPSDCITEPGSGFITVVKNADPDLISVGFEFAINNGSADLYNLTIYGSGSSDRLSFLEGTYSVSEVVPADWTLDTAACVDVRRGSVGTFIALDNGFFDISVQSGDDITCTFANSIIYSPVIVTTPSPEDGYVGDILYDSAQLTEGFNPSGSITFKLFDPQDSTCEGDPAYTESVDVSGNGVYNTPTGYQSNMAGTWRWVAEYSGDAYNNPASSGCNDEQVTIQKNATNTVTLPDPESGIVGVLLNDTALITIANPETSSESTTGTNALPITGLVTFRLYEPGDTACDSPVFTETVPVADSSASTSSGHIANLAGIWLWTAEYLGDEAYLPSSDQCGDEIVVVSKDTPSISTTPNPDNAMVWTRLHDTAVLTGGYFPTGTITFKLYPPFDPTCANPVHTETVPLVNQEAQTVDGFVSNIGGTWRWKAYYSGDVNNNPVSSGCNEEQVIIKNHSLYLPVIKDDYPQPVCSIDGKNIGGTYTVRVSVLWEYAAPPEIAPEPHRIKWGDTSHTKFSGESGHKTFYHTYELTGWYYVSVVLWGYDGNKHIPCSMWIDPPPP